MIWWVQYMCSRLQHISSIHHLICSRVKYRIWCVHQTFSKIHTWCSSHKFNTSHMFKSSTHKFTTSSNDFITWFQEHIKYLIYFHIFLSYFFCIHISFLFNVLFRKSSFTFQFISKNRIHLQWNIQKKFSWSIFPFDIAIIVQYFYMTCTNIWK